jgi:hypothetical protein
MPIDKVTRKKRETTTEECISVIEKNAEGKSYREIAEITSNYIRVCYTSNTFISFCLLFLLLYVNN